MGGQGVGFEGEGLAEIAERVCVGHRFTIARVWFEFGDDDQVSMIFYFQPGLAN